MDAINFTIEEAVSITKIGRSQIYVEIAAGRMQVFKVGRRTLISADALREWQRGLIEAANKVREGA